MTGAAVVVVAGVERAVVVRPDGAVVVDAVDAALVVVDGGVDVEDDAAVPDVVEELREFVALVTGEEIAPRLSFVGTE